MATSTARTQLQSIVFLLLFTIHYALCGQSRGILSSLYKKAAQENRPLILVLDNAQGANSLTDKFRDIDNSPKSLEYSSKNYYEPKKQSSLDIDRDDQNSLPFVLLKKLGLQNSEKRNPISNYKAHDHSLTRSRSRSRLRSRNRDRRLRLRSRLTKDDIVEKDKRDRRDRDWRDWDDRDNHDDRDRRDRIKDNRDDGDYNKRDLDLNKIKSFIAKNFKDDREPHEKERDAAQDRALRSSVIKNLLRYSNDLNCEAKDECADTCDDNYNGKKKDECEDKCEQKYECEDEKEEEKDECDLGDSCGEEAEDQNPSTRGERLVEEKNECKRC